MTTTHIANRINQLGTPNDTVLETDAAGTQKTPSGPWAIVSPRPQGIRVMQLVLSRSEPGVLIDTSGMVPYYGVLRDLWGTETNIPEASKQSSVRIVFHKDTEATPLGQHFPRSANTGDAIWLHLLGEASSVTFSDFPGLYVRFGGSGSPSPFLPADATPATSPQKKKSSD